MKTKLALLAILSFISFSCIKENEKIILTKGIDENPKSLRFGIELSNEDLYYCEETTPLSGKYNYFHLKISPKQANKIIKDITSIFDKIDTITPHYQDRIFELILIFDDKIMVKRFGGIKFVEIENLIKLKDLKMDKIHFHEFPKELLEERLPKFIPPTTNNDSM